MKNDWDIDCNWKNLTERTMTIKNPRHLKTGTNSIDPRHIKDFEKKVCIICKRPLTILDKQRTKYVKHTSFFENSLHRILVLVHPNHKRKLFYLLREYSIDEIWEMNLDEELDTK